MMDDETREKLSDRKYIEENIQDLSDEDLRSIKPIRWNPDGDVGRLVQHEQERRAAEREKTVAHRNTVRFRWQIRLMIAALSVSLLIAYKLWFGS